MVTKRRAGNGKLKSKGGKLKLAMTTAYMSKRFTKVDSRIRKAEVSRRAAKGESGKGKAEISKKAANEESSRETAEISKKAAEDESSQTVDEENEEEEIEELLEESIPTVSKVVVCHGRAKELMIICGDLL